MTGQRSEALVSSLSKMDSKGKATRTSSASAPSPARSKKKPADSAAPTTHEYVAVVNHESDPSTGERTRYQVLWKHAGPTGEQLTWTDARRFQADAARAEGATNVVAVYEAKLTGVDLEGWSADANFTVADAVRQLRVVEFAAERRAYLDLDMSKIPFNPHMWPPNLRTVMSYPGRLNFHEQLLWAESYADYQLRAEWSQHPFIQMVFRRFFSTIRALAARRI